MTHGELSENTTHFPITYFVANKDTYCQIDGVIVKSTTCLSETSKIKK